MNEEHATKERIDELESVLSWFTQDYLNASTCDYEESLAEISDATGFDIQSFWWTEERLLARMTSEFSPTEVETLRKILRRGEK